MSMLSEISPPLHSVNSNNYRLNLISFVGWLVDWLICFASCCFVCWICFVLFCFVLFVVVCFALLCFVLFGVFVCLVDCLFVVFCYFFFLQSFEGHKCSFLRVVAVCCLLRALATCGTFLTDSRLEKTGWLGVKHY